MYGRVVNRGSRGPSRGRGAANRPRPTGVNARAVTPPADRKKSRRVIIAPPQVSPEGWVEPEAERERWLVEFALDHVLRTAVVEAEHLVVQVQAVHDQRDARRHSQRRLRVD